MLYSFRGLVNIRLVSSEEDPGEGGPVDPTVSSKVRNLGSHDTFNRYTVMLTSNAPASFQKKRHAVVHREEGRQEDR